MKRLAGLLCLLLAAQAAYAATVIAPSCAPCNLGDNLTISVAPDPIVTTARDVTLTTDLRFSPNVTSVITGNTVFWKNLFGVTQFKVKCLPAGWESAYMNWGQTVNGTFTSACNYQLYNLSSGAVFGVLGEVRINPVPSLLFKPPGGPNYPKTLEDFDGVFRTSQSFDGTSQLGEWALNFQYTSGNATSYLEEIKLNVTNRLNISASAGGSIKQWQNIGTSATLLKADGRALEAEQGSATCHDITEPGKTKTINFTGGSISCTIDNITQLGAHQAQIDAAWKNNTANATVAYNVTYYYDSGISANSPISAYTLGTYANITVTISPAATDPGLLNIDGTIYAIDLSAGSNTITHQFTGAPRNASITFNYTDTKGRKAYANASVRLLNEYTLEILSATGRQESNATINARVRDINNRSLGFPVGITCNDNTEPASAAAVTNATTGAGFCVLPLVAKYGAHSFNVTAGNTAKASAYYVDSYYITRIGFSTTSADGVDAINLLVPFNITLNVTDPNGLPKPGLPGNTGAAGCTNISAYKWACESRPSEGTLTATYSYTEPVTGRVAYGQKTLNVTRALTLELNRGDMERIDPLTDAWTIVTVKDATGQPAKGATVQCWEGATKLGEGNTSAQGIASCVHNMAAGLHTVRFNASWMDINNGENTIQYNFSDYTTPQESQQDNGAGAVISFAIAPNVRIVAYPQAITVKTQNETIIKVTVENTGQDDSESNYILLPEIPQEWYTWQAQKVVKGEKRELSIRFWIPADIKGGEYNTSLLLKGTTCGQKKQYANGSYYYTSGTCDTKKTRVYIETNPEEKTGEIETRINQTKDKEKELLLLIQQMQAMGLDTAQIQAMLDSANQQVSLSKAELNQSKLKNSENALIAAENTYQEGITTSTSLISSIIDPIVTTLEARIKILRANSPEGSEENVEKANLLLTQARNQMGKKDYAGAKATLDEAYGLIRGLSPAEKAAQEQQAAAPAQEEGFKVPLGAIFAAVVLAAAGAIAVMKKEQIKSAIETIAERMARTKIKSIAKHAWPMKLRPRVENTVSINIGFRNTSKGTLKNIAIQDLVPISFKIEEGSFLLNNRAIIPAFKNTVQGTLLEWNAKELKPEESIILAYKVKIVPIGELIKLAPVNVRYEDKGSNAQAIESETVMIEVVKSG